MLTLCALQMLVLLLLLKYTPHTYNFTSSEAHITVTNVTQML